jgi:hypothetical protein
MAANKSQTGSVAVYLEQGKRRVFACALDWPGWCRSGKDEAQALDALAAAGTRYAAVATAAGLELPRATTTEFKIVERLAGSTTTDFGVPDKTASADLEPLSRKEGERLAALVAASWAVLDQVVATAPPVLRKGPRGGGRDRDAVFQHVVGAEASYARSLGIRMPAPAPQDIAAITELRDAILGTLRAGSKEDGSAQRRWPLRYAARRIAWHVLDHAWEIEDRSAIP